MTAQIPVKATVAGGVVTSLGQFEPGDTYDPNYFPSGVFATAAQGAKADSAVQPGSLATVATTGAYGDLSGKPTIPAAQVASDWNASSGVAAILNKPTLGTAAATNASAYATAAQGTKADSAVQPAALAVVQTTVPSKLITGNYTLSDADAGWRLRVNSAVGVTITDPGTLTPDKVILVQQIGTGQPTISGPNVQSFAATTKLAGQRAMAVITIDSSTVTYVNGELAAS